MKNIEVTTETVETTEVNNYRLTSTGRPTLVGTRKCSECGRAEYHTKKYEQSQNPEDLNQRYTLCKGVCVYCYAQKRNKKSGTSLTVQQLEDKIKFYNELLEKKIDAEYLAENPE